ncbi:MAG: hypothetical protein HOP19_11365 [Acidobacteria bacterium]|nr:hypothetical protein [Acidobacteriota bacterium]
MQIQRLDQPVQLTFSLAFHYADDASGIIIPMAVRFAGYAIETKATVDPGATVCLFKREHGEELGIPIERGELITLGTLGRPIQAYGHEIVLQTGDIAFESIVYFAKAHGLKRNLLGRQGWARKILLGINDDDCMLYLNSLT